MIVLSPLNAKLSLFIFMCFAIGISSFMLLGCDEESDSSGIKIKWYNVVYRENADGTMSKWEVYNKLERWGPLLCWDNKYGKSFCISGKITVVPTKVEVIVAPPEEKEKEPGKEEEKKEQEEKGGS